VARELYPLTGVVRDYAWGSLTAIPDLLGEPASDRPAAELWFGAHADDSAFVTGTSTTLLEVIDADPQHLLGAVTIDRFGAQLPFLLKILAAEHALSIQVHPTLDQARAGFADEDARGIARDATTRNYRDPNHKPELLCALTEFDALCGFRPIADTLRLLAALDLSVLGPITAQLGGLDGLRAAFVAVLALPGPVVAEVVAASAGLTGEWAGLGAAIARAAQDYPGDVGLVLMLLLNFVRLQPGEAIFLGAGNVHAYLHGLGVEIMASSDNVLRCGLTPKHVDVEELLRITDFAPLADPRCPVGPGRAGFDIPVPDFAMASLVLAQAGPCRLASDQPQILLCTAGSARVATGAEEVRLTRGRAVYVSPHAQVRVDGDATLFVATVG
jgi:mannose-6-phosphate isomerase